MMWTGKAVGGARMKLIVVVLAVVLTSWPLLHATPPAPAGIPSPSPSPFRPGASPIAITPVAFPPPVARPDVAARTRVAEAYGRVPMRFEPNDGQFDDPVRFVSRGLGYSLFLTASEAVMVLPNPAPGAEPVVGGTPQKRHRGSGRHTGTSTDAAPAPAVVRMKLLGARSTATLHGEEQFPSWSNYFLGNDPTRWRTKVAHYGRVRYESVYPGIDLVFYGNQRQLEYDFVVAPGVDPGAIALDFDGATAIDVDGEGHLSLATSAGTLQLRKPFVYQTVDGVKREIAGRYVVDRERIVRFQLAAYDVARELVIDPILVYSTYLGGNLDDTAWDIAVDSSGNAWVTGQTNSTSTKPYPVTAGLFGPFGGYDVFVSMLNSAGALVASSYVGGSGTDRGFGIAVDNAGNAYVTGETRSDNFPFTPGAFQTIAPSGGDDADAFVIKVTTQGLVYATYLGGTLGDDFGNGIAVDSQGNAYIAGETDSTDYPKTGGAFQVSLVGDLCTFGGSSFICSDAFVTKLNAQGTGLVYSTFLGGTKFDEAIRIAIDGSGNAYVVGETCSTDFPRLNAHQNTHGGGACAFVFGDVGAGDAFVAKLNPSGTALVFSTFLGGSGDDSAFGVAVDGQGAAYVTGFTPSANFPTLKPIQPALPGGSSGSAFVAKLTSAGVLVYSTYLGGSGAPSGFNIALPVGSASARFDVGVRIAVDGTGQAHVVGVTGSGDLPRTFSGQLPLNALQLQMDVFVFKLDATGTALLYSTYLGGSDVDIGLAIALDSSGNAYVTGATSSSNFPRQSAHDTTFNSTANCSVVVVNIIQSRPCPDAFVAKLDGTSGLVNLQFVQFPGTFPALPVAGKVGVAYKGNVGIGGGTPPFTVGLVAGTLPPGLAFGSPNLEGTPAQAGLFLYTVQVQDQLNAIVQQQFTNVIVDGSTSALVVGKAGSGSGTVTSNPAGIACGDDCAELFVGSKQMTLTAVPIPGSTFSGWSGGGCAGTGSCTVTLATGSATTVGATFTSAAGCSPMPIAFGETKTDTLTTSDCAAPHATGHRADLYTFTGQAGQLVSISMTATASQFTPRVFLLSPAGTIVGQNLSCTSTPCIPLNGTVTLPTTGTYTIEATSSTLVNGGQSYSLSLDRWFNLNVGVAGSGAGTVTSNPAGVNCTASCGFVAVNGFSITLLAAQGNGSFFKGWSGPCGGTGSCALTIDGETSPTATFSLTFSDDPMPALGAIKAVHLTQLRTAIDALRARFSLPLAFAGPETEAIVARSTAVKASHFLQLRNALTGLTSSCANVPIGAGARIDAAHLAALRACVRSLE